MMSTRPNTPVLQANPRTGLSALVAQYVREAKAFGTRYRVTVLAGFETDGASDPRICWGLWGSPWDAVAIGGAVIHDALYAAEAMDRRIADEILWTLWRRDGMSWLRAWTGYRAVRLAGWAVWAKHTRQSIDHAKHFVIVETL